MHKKVVVIFYIALLKIFLITAMQGEFAARSMGNALQNTADLPTIDLSRTGKSHSRNASRSPRRSGRPARSPSPTTAKSQSNSVVPGRSSPLLFNFATVNSAPKLTRRVSDSNLPTFKGGVPGSPLKLQESLSRQNKSRHRASSGNETTINVAGSKSSQNSKLANDHISLNLRSKDDIPEEIVVAFKSDIMESIGFVVLCLMIVIGVCFCIMSELTLSVTVFIILSVLSGLIAFTMKLLEGKHYYIFSVFFSFIGLAIYRVHGNSVLYGLAITFLLITSFWNKGSELLRKSLPDPPIDVAEKDTLLTVKKSEDQVFSKLFGNR